MRKTKKILAFFLSALCLVGAFGTTAGMTATKAHAAGLTSATPSSYIIIGDSRTYGMANSVSGIVNTGQINGGTAYDSGRKTRYSAKSGEGINWMKNYGVPNVERYIGQNTAVIIWMGTNDAAWPGHVSQYAGYIKSKASGWINKGARVYFATCGSVYESRGTLLKNHQINSFNSTVVNGLKGSGVQIIDVKKNVTDRWDYSYYTADGLHYQTKASQAVHSYMINTVNADFKAAYKPATNKVVTGGFTDINNGIYTIQSAVNKNFVIDISGASKNNSVQYQVYQSNGTNAQKFRIERIGSTGYYKVTNINSNKVMDVRNASYVSQNPVQQYQWNGTDAQHWIIRKNSNGTYTFLSKVNALALDLQSAIARNCQKLWLYTPNGTKAQQFYLAKVG